MEVVQYEPSDLFDLLFDRESGGEHLAMVFHAYMDDSGNAEQLSVSGAILGKKEGWTSLSKRWQQRLDQDGLAFFKSTYCKHLRGPFEKFRDYGLEEGKKKAFVVRDDLDQIIRTSDVMMLGVTLSIPFFRIMKSDPIFGDLPKVPYRLAFQQTLAECARAMQVMGRGNVVTFGHDDGDDYPILHELFKEFKKRNPKYAGIMGDFVPLDDKINKPTQAADVAAEVIFRTMLESAN